MPDEVRAELEEVMRDFKAPVRFAFAYGSGVFRQNGYNPEVCLYFSCNRIGRKADQLILFRI